MWGRHLSYLLDLNKFVAAGPNSLMSTYNMAPNATPVGEPPFPIGVHRFQLLDGDTVSKKKKQATSPTAAMESRSSESRGFLDYWV